MSSESSFKSEDSVSDGDSVSDNGEESETERINTKYSKRFDALEDYKEKNTLLSEMSVKNVMNKLDKDEELSTQELETLNRTFRLMDKTIPNDQDSLERMQLYEAFSEIVPSEISENNERIEHHEKKISEYLARLEELKQENSEMSSDNDSSDSNSTIVPNTNNPSNSPGPDDSSNLPGPDNPSGSSGPDDDDDDGFDDFPPSFDFDDF
jgi:predicted RNase H-like nuclease (RuvC/YqgF family)